MHTLKQWPAFLFDLIPQGGGRQYLLGELQLADNAAADFPLMCAGAFNPIGRVRVAEAASYYQSHVVRHDNRLVRHGKVQRLHQESAASLAGIVGFDNTPSQFELLKAIRTVVTDPTGETIEFLKRDILNLAMRNTDNHARNTAVQVLDGAIRLTPLFDFAPMYLDPAGIARAARWYQPGSRQELHQWREVLDALQIRDKERALIRLALHRFGKQMSALDQHMKDAGVDDDITAFLQPHIAGQIQQLQTLEPS